MDANLTKTVEEKTCGRCNGTGMLKSCTHVLGGVCFRCWGLGTDPQTIEELEVWLAKARYMWSVRSAAAKAAAPTQKAVLVKEMALIEKLGKQNRRRVDSLRAAFKAFQERAKEMHG